MSHATQTSAPLRKSESDLALHAAGKQTCAPGSQYGPIFRTYHGLHFVLSGAGTFAVQGSTYRLTRGQAFICPGQELVTHRADDNDPWSYCWLSFSGSAADSYIDMLQSVARRGRVLEDLDMDKYQAMIVHAANYAHGGPARHFASMSALYGVLACLCTDLGLTSSTFTREGFAAEALFYIDSNIGKNLRVSHVATHLGVHPNYLTRCFKEEYGVSPKRYILDHKLGKARMLVENSSEPLSLIAQSLGFSSLAAFSRAFKQRFGEAPSTLREASA